MEITVALDCTISIEYKCTVICLRFLSLRCFYAYAVWMSKPVFLSFAFPQRVLEWYLGLKKKPIQES